MVVTRKPGYYVWNVLMPMLFISAISLGAFEAPREEVPDRLSVSMTMLLTAVAFKLQISASTPQIGYLTLLDKYVLYCFFLIAGVCLENILATNAVFAAFTRYVRLLTNGQVKVNLHPDEVDVIAAQVFIALWGVAMLLALGMLIYGATCSNSMSPAAMDRLARIQARTKSNAKVLV